jgi:hypothetical protein
MILFMVPHHQEITVSMREPVDISNIYLYNSSPNKQ